MVSTGGGAAGGAAGAAGAAGGAAAGIAGAGTAAAGALGPGLATTGSVIAPATMGILTSTSFCFDLTFLIARLGDYNEHPISCAWSGSLEGPLFG